MKRQESTDVLHLLLPQLEAADIPIINIKTDTATRRTRNLRGDVWVSREPFISPYWEQEIVSLIEAKTPYTTKRSKDWADAVRQGNTKAVLQGLPFFVVTNTSSLWQYYRVGDNAPITLDGNEITTPLGLRELEILYTQISPLSSNAVQAIAQPTRSYSKKLFQSALWQVKNVYRNCAIDNTDSKIYTTITFVVLKYVAEQERIRRTLPKSVMLWDDWREGNLDRDIRASIEDIRRSNLYSDVVNELSIAPELQSIHCSEIRKCLSDFQFSGCNFDLYGAVYESFADPKTKREFGQYYTSRHITSVLSEIMLRDERLPRASLKICDPACGTGGFLTEAYRVLLRNYTASGALQGQTLNKLRRETFYGYDIKERNISLARINMCLAGDGHTNIAVTDDSLITLLVEEYNYILTNVPYGVYKGIAEEGFYYSGKKRYETLFVEKIVKALRPNGKAAIIIPDGVLESPSLEDFRVHLLSEAEIEAVISLHPYVFRPYTTEKTYALILRKLSPQERGKKSKNPVYMYVLENDGFQKGDKRYPIKENDIPDLKAHYFTTRASAPHMFVPSSAIGSQNFHNLLPEFYLEYYEEDYWETSMSEYQNLIARLDDFEKKLKDFSS
jgi:type I restriction-modification system DNA methylase subunit